MVKNSITDLYDYGYKIVQNDDYFKMSLDSIVLADFIKIDYTDKNIIDLCSGNCPIPIIPSSNKKLNISAMEIQPEIYELGMESININNIHNIKYINDDIKNIKNYFPGNNFDIVCCNPPYFKYDKESIINKNSIKSIARHEISIDIESIIRIASEMLNDKGKLYLVFRTERMIELIDLLKKFRFGIKRMQFVYNSLEDNCSMFLMEAKKNAKDNIKVMQPLLTKNYRGDFK